MAHTAETERRILAICAIMRERWFNKNDRATLGEQWDVGPDRVSELACEASKRMLSEVTDHDVIKAEGGLALRQIIRDGVDSDNPKDRQNAIKAIDVWASVMGASAAKKVEVSGGVNLDDLDAVRKAAGANCQPTTPKKEPNS